VVAHIRLIGFAKCRQVKLHLLPPIDTGVSSNTMQYGYSLIYKHQIYKEMLVLQNRSTYVENIKPKTIKSCQSKL